MTTTLRAAYVTWVRHDLPTANYFNKTAYLQVSEISGKQCYAIIWFTNPFPASGGNVLSATLTLKTRAISGGSDPNHLTAQLCAPWSNHFGSVNWNTRPSGKLGQVTLSKAASLGANTAWSFDVTSQMQAVASGEDFAGFIISTDTARNLLVQGNQSAALDPVLEMEWTEAPLAPDDLSPSTGQAVGTGTPMLRWSFWDHAGATSLQSVQVQTATAEDGFSSPAWDSGEVATSWCQMDLSAQSGFTAPDADTLVWWRVRNRDSAGLWSAWSDPASFQYHALPTVTLSQPDPTPSDHYGSELLTNGGFESGSLSGWTASSGWVVATDKSHTGSACAQSKTENSTLTQTIDVTGGSTIGLSLWCQGKSSTGAKGTVTLTPDVGDAVSMDAPTGTDGTWHEGTSSITLDAKATTLTVTITSTGSDWLPVDDVSLKTVETYASFTDPTPPIEWSYSGDMAQVRWRASVSILQGSVWKVVASSGTVISAETSWTPDAGLANAGTARIIVDVWDGRAREATPGFPTYASAAGDFTFDPSDSVEAPANLAITTHGRMPMVDLSWTRSETPDRWDVYRDGTLLSRHDGLDWSTGGDAYSMTDKIAPNGTHSWTLFAIVNGVACKSQQITATIKHAPTWIVDNDTDERVCIAGDGDHDMTMPETVNEFTPIGARSVVRITSAQRGYEGTITGYLVPWSGMPATESVAAWRDRLARWKGQPGRPLYLVAEDFTIPVQVSEITWHSMEGQPGTVLSVSVKFHQTGDYLWQEAA